MIDRSNEGNGSPRRINNARIFRPEAIEAYVTRRAGDPWLAGTRGERIAIVLLTLVAIAAAILIVRGGV